MKLLDFEAVTDSAATLGRNAANLRNNLRTIF